jgi:hypothetical protein
MSGQLEGDRSLVVAELAASEKISQTKAQLLAMSIPPVDGETARLHAVTTYELHGV